MINEEKRWNAPNTTGKFRKVYLKGKQGMEKLFIKKLSIVILLQVDF